MNQESIRRITNKHLRRKKAASDLAWFAKQIEQALDLLQDAVDVADAQVGEGTSLSDDFSVVSRAVRDIRMNISRDLGKHLDALRATGGGRRAAVGRPLDHQTRQKVNLAFNRAGLDGNSFFTKAEHGYGKAVDVMGEFGIELGDIVNSFVFTRPEGRFTVDLAWKNPEDPFSPVEIPNSMLTVSFHQMESGRFEVIAYLS